MLYIANCHSAADWAEITWIRGKKKHSIIKKARFLKWGSRNALNDNLLM